MLEGLVMLIALIAAFIVGIRAVKTGDNPDDSTWYD